MQPKKKGKKPQQQPKKTTTKEKNPNLYLRQCVCCANAGGKGGKIVDRREVFQINE